MNLIELRDVCAGYPGADVLKNISLSFRAGEFTALIGPNGAGKSTLMKTIAGNIVPSSGAVSFNGTPRRSIDAAAFAREVSVVHQTMENIPPFSVTEFVRLGRFPHLSPFTLETTGDTGIIENAMERAGVTHLRNRILMQLSGGELQLVCIARALAQSDRVILLDEPISHLDISHSVGVMDLLHSLNEKGTTVLTVLHDINIASDYCHRIVALKNGEVFASGTPAEVIDYRIIERLFDTVCVVFENPITKKPYTFPVPGYMKSGQ